MFSTTAVGKKISTLRKARNMTQMELADLMGVSYQAVSNWERGNSMPDISKLPELAEIFGVTIDELLGSASPLIKSAAENKMDAYLEENEVTVDELTEAAPILKPDQVDAAMDSVPVETVKELAGVAPFASGAKIGQMVDGILTKATEQLHNLSSKMTFTFGGRSSGDREERAEQKAEAAMESHDLDGIEELAPFLSEESLAKIARQFIAEGRSIAGIAPHMDEDDLAECARLLVKQGGDISSLLPFMDEDDVGECAAKLIEQGKDISSFLPFMEEDDVSECAAKLIEQGKDISSLLPFMDEDNIGECAAKFVEQGKDISNLLPFMDEDVIGECAAKLIEQGKDISNLLPFMDEDVIGECAHILYEKNGVNAIVSLAPFMDSDTLQEIVEDAIEKHGYKAILPLAPYLK